MKITEKQIQKSILQYLSYLPDAKFWEVNTTGVFDKSVNKYIAPKTNFRRKGVSDIIGFYKNKFWAFEVKHPDRKNNISKYQKEFLDSAKENNQESHVVWEVNQVAELLCK